MIIEGIRTSIAKKSYIFVIFQVGRGVRTHCPRMELIGIMLENLVLIASVCSEGPSEEDPRGRL